MNFIGNIAVGSLEDSLIFNFSNNDVVPVLTVSGIVHASLFLLNSCGLFKHRRIMGWKGVKMDETRLVEVHNKCAALTKPNLLPCPALCPCFMPGHCMYVDHSKQKYQHYYLCPDQQAPGSVIDEINALSVSREELSIILTENAMLSSVVEFKSVNKESGLIPTEEFTEQIKYQTWQEEGCPVVIPNADVVVLDSSSEVELAKDSEAIAETTKNSLMDKVACKDEMAAAYANHHVVGFVDHVVGHDNSPCVNWYKSSFGQISYYALMFFGYRWERRFNFIRRRSFRWRIHIAQNSTREIE